MSKFYGKTARGEAVAAGPVAAPEFLGIGGIGVAVSTLIEVTKRTMGDLEISGPPQEESNHPEPEGLALDMELRCAIITRDLRQLIADMDRIGEEVAALKRLILS